MRQKKTHNCLRNCCRTLWRLASKRIGPKSLRLYIMCNLLGITIRITMVRSMPLSSPVAWDTSVMQQAGRWAQHRVVRLVLVVAVFLEVVEEVVVAEAGNIKICLQIFTQSKARTFARHGFL